MSTGNAAAVVPDRNRAVHVDRHLDLVAITGQMFVNRVVEHLEHAVVQAAFIGVADVHAGPFADGLQTFQFVNFGCVILLDRTGCRLVFRLCHFSFFRHK